MSLYPLKFKTIYKEKIWGGNKFKELLGKKVKEGNKWGESWEISCVEDNISVVSNGYLAGNELHELIEVYMGDMVGDSVYEKFGLEFPLLIKFLDANDWLSVQVHPDDQMAMERHDSFGKTEMWYVFQADEGAKLISGFNKKVSKEDYLTHADNNSLKEILNYEHVKAGDVFVMPAGRVHSLGPGICLAEIQQTSDVTYRIYDWDRVDEDGQPREMHTDEAVDAIDFTYVNNYKTDYNKQLNVPVNLAQTPYFTTNLLDINTVLDRSYNNLDSFVILICVEGSSDINYGNDVESIKKGETVLIPASIKNIVLKPKGETKILEVFIESNNQTSAKTNLSSDPQKYKSSCF